MANSLPQGSVLAPTMFNLHCESEKKQDTKLLLITSPNVNRFSSSFTGILSGKFATNSYLNIPPHLNYVATLLVKYECQKTGGNLEYVL